MAAILNSGGASAAATALPAVGGLCVATGTGATPGAPAQGAADAATDVFTQLIADMIGASNAPPQQGATPSLQDLAAIEAGTNASELSGDERDSGSDTDEEDAGALAVAVLLPGLSCPAPVIPAPAIPAPAISAAASNAATDAIGAVLAQRADSDATQAAVDELSGNSTDAAGNAAPADSTTTAGTDARNTTPTPSTPMHALLATHAAARDINATPDATLSSPVGTPAWKDELGTQLTWMAVNGREAASLRLTPEHMGPVEIRISVHEGEASVYFGATNPDTRSALEQSLPRLRELFASQGLVLADAGVSRDAPRNAFKPSAQPPGPRGVSDAAHDAPVKSVTLARLGLIDTYV